MAAIPSPSGVVLPAGAMMLRVGLPPRTTTSVALSGQRLVIGRSADTDIPIESDTVSRRHAELVIDPFGRWWVRDLGSRNGTRVNGVKLAESLLEPGDVVQLGECVLTLCPPAAPVIAATQSVDVGSTIVDSLDRRIQRLRELQMPRIDHSHLTSIVEFGHGINVTQDPGQRLARLCNLIVSSSFKGRSAMVLHVPRAQPEKAEVVFGPQVAQAAGPQPTSISASVLRAICESPEPVLATNVSTGPDQIFLTMPADVMALAVVAAPISFDEQSAEVLYVTLPPECGNSDWLALLGLAVKQYQQAESVWLNVGKIKEYAVIRRELERAQQIQRRLVPRKLEVPGLELAVGFRPCQWVGGDCVAVTPMADGRVLLAVADVCGKGLSAALVASCVHTMLYSAARTRESLVQMISALNDYLCEYVGIECFATLLAVAIDPVGGECESVCAGHPRALIVNSKGDIRTLDSEGNCPLGITEQKINSGRDQLKAGEALMLFSDGISELHDEFNRMLGSEGLAEGLRLLYPPAADQPLARMVEQVEQCLEAYRGRAVAQDDQTFLLARLRST